MASVAGISAGSVVATLMLNSNPFTASLQSAKAQLSTFANSSNSASVRFGALGSAMTTVGTTMTKNVSLPILGVGAAALKAGDDFESQMSRVKAISGATGSDFNKLEKDAINLGKTSSFSSMEVAQGMENMASAGFSTNEIISAMPGLLNLASSSGESLAVSSDIVAGTLRGFGLAASDTTHVADVLAKASADTNAQVSDMGDALKYISPVASSAGWSLESVSAALGEMANNNIKGSQAGTILRQTFSQLAKPSDEAAKLMKQIGFNAFDSQGKMKSLSGIVDNLKQSTKGMTDQQRDYALTTIFGTESLSGMEVLLTQGSGKLDTLTNSLKNSDGAGAKMSKTMNDNVNGSIKAMMGSLEDMMIKIQQIIAPSVRDFAKTITDLANKFTSLPTATQKAIVNIGLLVATTGPVLVASAKVIKSIETIGGGIKALGSGIKILGSGFKSLGGLISSGTSAMINFGKAAGIAVVNATKMTAELAKQGLQWAFVTTKMIAHKIAMVASTIATNLMNAAQAALNLVMSLNPITLIIIAIAALAAALVILYNKNEAFRNLVNNVFSTIKNVVGGVINDVIGFFQSLVASVQSVGNGIKNGFNEVVSWFEGLPSRFIQFGSNMINGLSNGISSVLGTIGGVVSSGFSSAISFITRLPSEAFTWGSDMIQGIVKGIKAAAGAVGAAVSGVAQDIRKFLHFSVPDEGPLADYESWMPDMMSGLAKGITSKKSLVTNAIKGLSTDMSLGLNANVLGVKNASTSSQGDYSTIAGMLTDLANAFANYKPQLIINGREFAYATAPQIDKALGWLKSR